jgi:putative oxidoreductase
MMQERVASFSPYMLGMLRVVTALLFMQHGFQKLFGFPGGEFGPFVPWSLMGIAGMLETFGGFVVLLGFWTRPVAFALSGQMAVAYFLFHASAGLESPLAFFPIVNGGELAILFSFVFLLLSVSGPGRFSIDGWRNQNAPARSPA